MKKLTQSQWLFILRLNQCHLLNDDFVWSIYNRNCIVKKSEQVKIEAAFAEFKKMELLNVVVTQSA